MRETTFKILTQGNIKMAHCQGYMVVGNGNAVCFFIDPCDDSFISASTESPSGCPVVYISRGDYKNDTVIEFSEFPGWRFHAGRGGKVIAVALVRRASDYALSIPNNQRRYWKCECCGSVLVTEPQDSAENYQCPQCHKALCDHGGQYTEISTERFIFEAGLLDQIIPKAPS